MKIKTKAITYEELQSLPTLKRKKLKKPSWLFQTLVRILSIPELLFAKFSYKKVNVEKAEKGPCLILMNHSSFLDLKIAAKLFWPKRYFIVATSDAFIGKEWLMRKIGCIPTRKFTPDIGLTRDITRALHEKKTSVLVYPEAGYSFDGRTTALPRNSGALLKKLDVPLFTVITTGAFLHQPLYNNLRMRKNKVTATLTCLFSRKEIREKTVEEIDQAIDEAFAFDDFKSQFENRTVIDDTHRAEGLHRLLYRCPSCHAEGETVGEGETLRCKKCGKEYRLTKFGQMQAIKGETEFSYISEWCDWQRACVRKEIENGTYNLSVDVDIAVIADYKALYTLGSGTLCQNENGLILTGCDGKLRVEQSPLFTHSLNSDYNWYEIDDMICIADSKRLYCCFTKGNNVATKARYAAEELYKIRKRTLKK